MYGAVTIYDTGWITRTVSAAGNPYLFTGRQFDPESGNYYYRARIYSPALGRFLSMDPLGFEAGDYNLYRYVGNNPAGLIDPMGAEECDPTIDFFLGLLYQYAANNYDALLGPPDSPMRQALEQIAAGTSWNTSFQLGRIAGSILSIGQGFIEAAYGLGMISGGAAGGLVTLPTGVGVAAGVAVMAGGVVVTAHAGAVTIIGTFRTVEILRTIDRLNMCSGECGGGESEKRTQHGEDRHAQGDSPTSEALRDKENPREVYFDNETGNTIYVGKNGRTHVFTPEGQHHTSFTSTRHERIGKVRSGKWTRLTR